MKVEVDAENLIILGIPEELDPLSKKLQEIGYYVTGKYRRYNTPKCTDFEEFIQIPWRAYADSSKTQYYKLANVQKKSIILQIIEVIKNGTR